MVVGFDDGLALYIADYGNDYGNNESDDMQSNGDDSGVYVCDNDETQVWISLLITG